MKLPSLEIVRKHIELLGAELAIATSISSNPSQYFSAIVLGIFNRGDLTTSFYNAFTSRLSLERPDFYPNEELVLASYTLLSQRINDPSYVELMKRMLKDSDVGVITKYYDLDFKGDDGLLGMRRISNHPTYKLKAKMRIPPGYFSELVLNFA